MLVCLQGAIVMAAEPSLEILWTSPVEAGPGSGLTLSALEQLPDHRLVALGNRVGPKAGPVLLFDVERQGPDAAIPVDLAGVPRERRSSLFGLIKPSQPSRIPGISSFAIGAKGEIWVAGGANTYLDIGSAVHSDAYLARLDETGKAVWERAFSNGGQRNIRSLAATTSGELALFGNDWRDGWLAVSSPDGQLRWEAQIAIGGGGEVAWLDDDRIAVAGFETTGSASGGDYRNHVAVWIFDRSGKVLTKTRIREDMNGTPGSGAGEIHVVAVKDALYVSSNKDDLSHAEPVMLSKIALDGTLMWSSVLPETILAVDSQVRSWQSCSPRLAVDVGGKPALACAVAGSIHLYRFDGATGANRQAQLPLPSCQAGRLSQIFFVPRDSGGHLLVGTRPGGNVGENCTWVGRLTGW